MTDLREMLVRLKGDSSSLTSSVAGADKSLRGLGETGNQMSATLQSAYAKVGEATKRVEVAQAQAALAMQRAQTAAHDDSLSLEQVVLASTKADLAAERVATAQANVASAMERAGMVAREEAQAEVQVSEKAEMAGRSLRESFSAGLNRVSEAGGGFIGHIRGMGSSLVGFLGAAGDAINGIQMLGQTAQWLGQALIGQNASMEQTRVAFIQLLGSAKAADVELKDLQQFAASTPFEFPELADATQKLLAFQFNLKDTKPLLTAIGDALSGLGKNNAATLEEVVHVFGQMHSTTHLMTGDLMQLTSVGINGFQILADQMHKPVSVIRDMIEQGLIPADKGIEMLRAGMEKTFGPGMQKQSETFNGLLSTFQDNIGAAWRAFTGPLFEKAKGALTDLGNLVSSKSFQDFATTMGGKVKDAIGKVGEVINAVVAAFKSPEFAKLGETLGRIFGPLADVITGPFKSAMGTLSGMKSSDITGFLRQAAQDVNDFLTALEGFQGGSSDFARAGYTVRDTAIQIGDATLQAWGVMQQVGNFLRDAFTPTWLQLQTTIEAQVIPAWNDLINSVGPLLPTLAKLGEAMVVIGGALVQLFARVLAYVTQVFGGIVQIVSGALQFILGNVALFVDLFNGDFGKLGQDLQAQWNGIIDIFRGALNILNGITGGALDALLHLFGTSIDQINAKAADMNKNTSKSANDMKKNVVQSLTDMKNQGLEQTTSLTWQAQGMFAAMGNQVGIDMANMDATAKGYWNDVADYINNHPLNVPLHNQGKIQHFAEGGDVPRTDFYQVGEKGPEIVQLPGGAHVYPHNVTPQSLYPSSMTTPLQGSNNQQPVIELHVHIDGQEIAGHAGDHQARMVRLHQARRVA